ncbi:hypothetical protein [Longimicrobium sp.]|uniref:hypothetical protein n=1 Tax=Longimicrobium sp. TaxID=2029185 RepID=UPI002E36B446|nr:hypothetical protein [Longimicrobium sp.]HEX6037775.1 hypothetical protein [Longimicrobium sp.]
MAEARRELPFPDVDISAVRRYANARANASSVREVARAVGMRHTSLEKFLNGSEPYAKNRALLCEWYLREHRIHPVPEATHDDVPVPVEDPETHIDALLTELRGEARVEARLRITTALSQAYRRMGIREPDWLYARA